MSPFIRHLLYYKRESYKRDHRKLHDAGNFFKVLRDENDKKKKIANYNILDYNLLISIWFFLSPILWVTTKKSRANRDRYNKSWTFFFFLFAFTIMFLLWREAFFIFISFFGFCTHQLAWKSRYRSEASLFYYYSTFSFPYESNGLAFIRSRSLSIIILQ